MNDKYDTSGNIEAQFEPGSDERVLANRLGVSNAEEMDCTLWDERKADYFAAVRAGLSDYEPMTGLVRLALRQSARIADG